MQYQSRYGWLLSICVLHPACSCSWLYVSLPHGWMLYHMDGCSTKWMIALNLCSPSCLQLFLIVCFSTTIQSWKQFPLLKANQESEVFLRMAVREIQVALYTWNGLFSHRVCPFAPSDAAFFGGLSLALRSHDQFTGLSLVLPPSLPPLFCCWNPPPTKKILNFSCKNIN